jgi:hypothetical protein
MSGQTTSNCQIKLLTLTHLTTHGLGFPHLSSTLSSRRRWIVLLPAFIKIKVLYRLIMKAESTTVFLTLGFFKKSEA